MRKDQGMRTARRAQGLALLIMSGLLALGGCAGSGPGQRGGGGGGDAPAISSSATVNYKIGKPYQVAGVWYYPQEDFDYDETGIASWYGPNFHEKLTANGEVFDQESVTAAHKTLQLPCVARVTNLENGRSIVVRINDRGPFANGRIIDLSRKSAQLLGMEGKGTAKVRVQVLNEESRILAGKLPADAGNNEPKVAEAAPRGAVSAETLPPPPVMAARSGSTTTSSSSGSSFQAEPLPPPAPSAQPPQQQVAAAPAPSRPPPAAAAAVSPASLAGQQVQTEPVHPTSLFVQAGSFGRHDNALRLSARLANLGNAQIQQATVQGRTVFRVRIGPIASVDDADRTLAAVVAAGQADARVIVD